MPREPSYQHVTIITLTLDFNKDVGSGLCGWRRRGRQSLADTRIGFGYATSRCCHFVVLRTGFLSSFLLLCYPSVFRALSCRSLREIVEPIIENVIIE